MKDRMFVGGLVCVLVVAALWVGKVVYRYPQVKAQAKLANKNSIEQYGKLPANLRAFITMPVDGEVRPSIRELLFWPFRDEVTCYVYVEGREWNSFALKTSDE